MRPFILVVVFALFLAGCGGSDSKDSGDSSDGPSLNDFIPGFVEFYDANAEQDYLQREREAQDRIAACMADQGFEYVPYVQNQDQGGFMVPDSQEAFVAEYGFGVATKLLLDQEFAEEAMKAETAKDPNNAIVGAMSETERDAYLAALWGEESEFDGSNASGDGSVGVTVAPADEPTGCQNLAHQEVFGQDATMEFYEQFGSMMEDIYGAFDSDPRVAAFDGEWSLCMAKQGYEFTTETDARIFLIRRLEEVGAITNLEIFDGGATKGAWSYGVGDIEPGSSVETAVKEVAAEEIAMAKVSLDCSADREKVFREVYRDAEQRFIDENLAELEQFKKDHSS